MVPGEEMVNIGSVGVVARILAKVTNLHPVVYQVGFALIIFHVGEAKTFGIPFGDHWVVRWQGCKGKEYIISLINAVET